MQLEKLHQKILAKEKRLKRYRDRYTIKTGIFKIAKENSSNKSEENTRRHPYNKMHRKQMYFGVKYRKRNNIIGKLNE